MDAEKTAEGAGDNAGDKENGAGDRWAPAPVGFLNCWPEEPCMRT